MYVHQITCISLQCISLECDCAALESVNHPEAFNSILQRVYSSVCVSLQQYIQKGKLSLRLCLDSELNAGLYSGSGSRGVSAICGLLVQCTCRQRTTSRRGFHCCQGCLFYILHHRVVIVTDSGDHDCTIDLLIHWPTECQVGG